MAGSQRVDATQDGPAQPMLRCEIDIAWNSVRVGPTIASLVNAQATIRNEAIAPGETGIMIHRISRRQVIAAAAGANAASAT